MRFKVLLITAPILLLNCGFVVSQSIKGLLIPKANQSMTLLPQSKTIQQVTNIAKDSTSSFQSANLPKGSFVPKAGQNNTFLPVSLRPKTIVAEASSVSNKVVQNLKQQNSTINNTIEQAASTGETVDTTGFSKIPTLESVSVQNPVSGLEQVDTTRLLSMKSGVPGGISSSNFSSRETVDTARLLRMKSGIKGNIETAKKSIETVDTAHLLRLRNTDAPTYISHAGSFYETVDTATLIARNKPKFVQDTNVYRPKLIYQAKTINGTILPFKGINTVFLPYHEDTTNVLAPLPDEVKDAFNFPGSNNFTPATPKGIGQLDDLQPIDSVHDIVAQSPLGQLDELPQTYNGGGNNNFNTGSYKFANNQLYQDTVKVHSDKKGKTFSGTLISKAGKSSLLQPEVVQKDTTTVVQGSVVDGASPFYLAPAGNPDELKVTFFVNQAGKYSVAIYNAAYIINLTQFGYIQDYSFRPELKKDATNSSIHKNPLGLVDNIAGTPIEYSETHTVTKVGNWVIKYTFDDMIKSVGIYSVLYNSNASVKKIDHYKVIYDQNKVAFGVEESSGLVIFKPEERRK
ncbi:MAG: hypothetical protein WCP65_04645 [Bacteroidota bacterium]